MSWVLHTLVGGGVLLFAAWLLVARLPQPVRRLRLGEWAIAAALLLAMLSLGPAWLIVQLPSVDFSMLLESAVWIAGLLYVGIGAYLLGRWLFGQALLSRLLWTAETAPNSVIRLCRDLMQGEKPPLVLMSRWVRVPFSCGAVHPTIVLPANLCQDAAARELRWVLAHELAHLRRGDAWVALLFGLGQAVYFPLPWFWWLRRQVRLSQEYLADAAAVAETGQPEEYAQFLLGWSQAPALPAGATGVSGHSSDLFRRITMLLQSRSNVEDCCPRRWSLLVAAGLIGLAVLAAGVGLPNSSAQQPADKKDEKKDDKKDDEKRIQEELRLRRQGMLIDPNDELTNDLLLQFARDLRLLMNDVRRNNFEDPFHPFNPLQPPVPVPGQAGRLMEANLNCLPTPLGASVEKPAAVLADQLELKVGQGLIVCRITAETPAAKAGLRINDILLEINGKEVPSDVGQFLKLLDGVKVDTPFDAIVIRKGKKETIKGLTVPSAKLRSDAAPVENGQPLQRAAAAEPPPLAAYVAAITAPVGVRRTPANPAQGPAQATSVRTGDKFTTRFQERGVLINVTGKMAAGKATPGEILVHDADGTVKYAEVAQVPEQYRNKVQSMVELTELNDLRITLRKK